MNPPVLPVRRNIVKPLLGRIVAPAGLVRISRHADQKKQRESSPLGNAVLR